MQYIISIIFLFAGLIFLFAFINLRLAIALYISYNILVPYLKLNFFGIALSYNLLNFVLFFSFLVQWKNKNKKIDYRPIIPFLLLYSLLFLISFLELETPLNMQLNILRYSFMKVCFVPFIIWNVSKDNNSILKYIKWAIIISIIIACIYGVFLMNLQGLNPYTSLLSAYFKEQDAAKIMENTGGDSRLSISNARSIQSTITHKMRWALNLCFILILNVVFFIKEKKRWYLVLLPLLLFNTLISGVRTGIATLVLVGAYYLIRIRNIKLLFTAGILLFLLNISISSNKELTNFFSSFTDVKGNKSDIRGSSISLRLEQLDGCFTEIRDNIFFGKGNGWTFYYQANKGDHPTILSFESLIFVVLCNNGFIGLFIWSIFFYLLFRLNRKLISKKADIIILDIFIICYLFFAIGTGEYDYLTIFSTFYSFLVSYLFYQQNIKYISKK
jgi:hypothetical protein